MDDDESIFIVYISTGEFYNIELVIVYPDVVAHNEVDRIVTRVYIS